MSGKSWVSRFIVPCPGNSSCKHCKPGEPSPGQHVFSKLVHETNSPEIPPSLTSQTVLPSVQHEKYLRRQKLMGTTFGNLEPVPFDPKVDPEPYACHICWSLLHMTRHCQEPETHIYCWNCGRKDVKVEECPRCWRAYRVYRKKKQCMEEDESQFREALRKVVRKEEDLQNGNATGEYSEDSRQVDYVEEDKQICKLKIEVKHEENAWDEAENTSVNSYDKCKIEQSVNYCKDELLTDVSQCTDEYSDSYYNHYHNAQSDELFTYLRNQKIQEQLELDRIKSKVASNYLSESEYYFFDDDEEENFDDYIVDEEEKSESLYSEDYTIRFFVDLLCALKHLSIDVQNTAVLNFVSLRKKQIKKKEMAQEGS